MMLLKIDELSSRMQRKLKLDCIIMNEKKIETKYHIFRLYKKFLYIFHCLRVSIGTMGFFVQEKTIGKGFHLQLLQIH